jgi:hypothetical protein
VRRLKYPPGYEGYSGAGRRIHRAWRHSAPETGRRGALGSGCGTPDGLPVNLEPCPPGESRHAGQDGAAVPPTRLTRTVAGFTRVDSSSAVRPADSETLRCQTLLLSDAGMLASNFSKNTEGWTDCFARRRLWTANGRESKRLVDGNAPAQRAARSRQGRKGQV